VSGVTYLAAFAVAYAAVKAVGPLPALAEAAVGTLAATVLVFVVSLLADNSSLYDPYWSLQPLALMVYHLWTDRDGLSGREILVAVLVFLYAVRLTSNFYRDWQGLGQEDFRYVDFRHRFGRLYWPVSFWGIHLFPTVMVYLGCLPLYALARTKDSGLGWLDGLATVVMLSAVALAFAADEQLRRFRRDPVNRGRHIELGLWAYCRHPNYLGEILTWWGLWLFALACGLGWWWTGVGAAAITLMFVFVSIPLMERRAAATRVGYGAYRHLTPMLLPWPRPVRRARTLG
jgi:steroid 5-alpha reductase family enzyme